MTERRTIIAAVVVAVVIAAAIVGVAFALRDDGADDTAAPAATARGTDEAAADRACRKRFSVGFSRAFIDAACPFYVPRALAGASNAEIVALPRFKEEICVEAGRVKYEAGEVATRLSYEEWLETVRRDCRAEIRGE
jgi:hypothetical protein